MAHSLRGESPRTSRQEPKVRKRAKASSWNGVWRKFNPKVRGEEQEPDRRGGIAVAGWHNFGEGAMEEMTRNNCRLLLAAFMEKNELTTRAVARAIGCSDATITRLLAAKTKPSDEMLKQVSIMIEVEFSAYEKLSDSEKEKLSEAIGVAGGGVLGFATISAAVSSLGSVAGLSAAGITSGLATLGSIVGGGMIIGVSVAAAIPLAAGAAGYAIIKAVKHLASEQQLNSTDIDLRWETEET